MKRSMSQDYTRDSIWQLQMNREGLRFYHPVHGCFLATTFRTFPDYDGEKMLDSMLHQLHLDLETTCTLSPNLESSTFYIVDGRPKEAEAVALIWPWSMRVLGSVISWYWGTTRKGLQILLAMVRLHRFRSTHGHHQDLPTVFKAKLAESGRLHEHPFSEAGLIKTFLVGLASITLYKQRYKSSLEYWSSTAGQLSQLLGLAVILHHLWYHIIINDRCHSSSLIAALAATGVTHMVSDSLLT